MSAALVEVTSADWDASEALQDALPFDAATCRGKGCRAYVGAWLDDSDDWHPLTRWREVWRTPGDVSTARYLCEDCAEAHCLQDVLPLSAPCEARAATNDAEGAANRPTSLPERPPLSGRPIREGRPGSEQVN